MQTRVKCTVKIDGSVGRCMNSNFQDNANVSKKSIESKESSNSVVGSVPIVMFFY